MKINVTTLFDQGDARWALKKLGFNSNPVYNFKNYACLLSCFSVISRYYGHQVDPSSLNDKLKALGPGNGFTAGSGNYVWGGITKVFGDIKEKLVNTPMPLTDSQFGEIKTSIDEGFPVVIQIDFNPKTVANDMHFVMIVDYNNSDENDLTIYDPIGGEYKSLKKYLGWFRPSARKTIERYIILRGKVPAQSGDTVAVDAKVFPNIIHRSSEWDKTVAEYVPDGDPTKTNFTDVQRVINGYKSDATNSKNTANEFEGKLKKSEIEVANQIDKLANLDAKCQRELKLKIAEITALKKAQPNIGVLKTEYEGTISTLESKLRDAQKAGGIKDGKIANLEVKLEQNKNNEETVSAFKKVILFVKSVWSAK